MSRLFEFGDLEWVPNWYHVYMRRYLVFYYRIFGYFKLWIPALTTYIAKTGSRSFLECCSGSGEVIGLITENLPDDSKNGKQFLLTDITPIPEFVERINNRPETNVRYISSPVDACSIPAELNYPRIFINSFHHFGPEAAARIVESAISGGQGIIILEYVRHSLLGYLSMLGGTTMILLTLPFVIKPRDLPLMILLTYIIPVFPLMFLWDGIASCLRVYNTKDLQEILSEHQIQASITGYTRRSLLYPAGVSAITLMPDTPKTRPKAAS